MLHFQLASVVRLTTVSSNRITPTYIQLGAFQSGPSRLRADLETALSAWGGGSLQMVCLYYIEGVTMCGTVDMPLAACLLIWPLNMATAMSPKHIFILTQ